MLDPGPAPVLAGGGGPPLLAVEELSVFYPMPGGGLFSRTTPQVHAVEDVSFTLERGCTLGIVGESGSGKTTTGRAVMLQVKATRGRIRYSGTDITDLEGEERRRMRRHMQLVFQDPYASLNARMTVLNIVAEPLIVHGLARRARDVRDQVAALVELVGLPADALDRYPHAFSGGQRQRIGFARALALRPKLIVCDEPVSALDVSVRAQVVNLFQDLQHQLGLTYLFIAHDLAIVRHISHRVAIMYAGRIVEIGDRDVIYDAPRHPYTQALLAAVLEPDPAITRPRPRQTATAEAPSVIDPTPGCRYHARCPLASERCGRETPPLTTRGANHLVA
jgi:peptide/nickel transport system ATP-binding protein